MTMQRNVEQVDLHDYLDNYFHNYPHGCFDNYHNNHLGNIVLIMSDLIIKSKEKAERNPNQSQS